MKGTFVHPNRSRSLTVAAIGGTVLAVTMLGLPSQAATGGTTRRHSAPRGGESTARTPGNVDVRQLSGTPLAKASRAEVNGRTKADNAYFRSLGGRAVVDIDPLTHTPRDFGRLDGFLSGPSSASARTAALNYVRGHLGALGLTSADLGTLRFRQDYIDTLGVHNLSWTQSVDGGTVIGNGLQVRVTRDGRVLAVQGSPVSGLAKLASSAPSATTMSASAARSASARDVDGTVAPAS